MIRPILFALLVAPTIVTAQAAAPAPKPEIFIRSPAGDATVATTFPVVFGLKNFGVAPAGVNATGSGHFHLLINTDAGAPGTVIPKDSLNLHFGTGLIETSLTLAPGTYTLRLVLGDFEHKVIGPDLVSKPVKITVKK